MSPTTYTAQMAAAATALKIARDVDDIAATLAALATMTRLVRLQYGAAKLASSRKQWKMELRTGLEPASARFAIASVTSSGHRNHN